ncbi:hypothetical protein GCM10007385_20590 [Tateyamaria omphalii]|nr:hypothetical protein GCM10007385_20590 [Tateyamaria omphalii]
MANSDRVQRHFDLSHLGGADKNVFDHKGRSEFMAHGGFDGLHVVPSSVLAATVTQWRGASKPENDRSKAQLIH